MPEDKIKKCPFCGGKGTLCNTANERTDPNCWYLQCQKCEIGTSRCYSAEEARNKWNRRKG